MVEFKREPAELTAEQKEMANRVADLIKNKLSLMITMECAKARLPTQWTFVIIATAIDCLIDNGDLKFGDVDTKV